MRDGVSVFENCPDLGSDFLQFQVMAGNDHAAECFELLEQEFVLSPKQRHKVVQSEFAMWVELEPAKLKNQRRLGVCASQKEST